MNLETESLRYKSTNITVRLYISAITRQILVALLGKLKQPALSHIHGVSYPSNTSIDQFTTHYTHV